MSEVVHEIRNQLTVAIANIEACLDGKLEPTPARLRGVVAALREVDALIDRAPRMPVESHAQRVVNVCALIEREATSMEATALEHDIALSFRGCEQTHQACASFRCDPSAVSQMLKNLLINAVRYTPRGGAIHVDCHREPGVMAFTVRDAGPGVLPEDRDSIFQRGIRGSAAGASAGSGLGLALVRDVVAQHGGDVQVGEAPGGGAVFTVHLPGKAVIGHGPGFCDFCGPHQRRTADLEARLAAGGEVRA
ncbi:MAG: hypothetical protein NVSMB64_31510 [Candidatus Velthaea sp.]